MVWKHLISFSVTLMFFVLLLGGPILFFMGFRQRRYRYNISTYLFLYISLILLTNMIVAVIPVIDISSVESQSVSMLMDFYGYLFIVVSIMCLLATRGSRKEFVQLFLLFLLPVVICSVIKNDLWRLGMYQTLLRPSREPLEPLQPLNALAILSSFNVAIAFACFYRYCIWRLRRLRKSEIGANANSPNGHSSLGESSE
jgi:hypothetical protein